jgi:3-dehydro-L-gulonate-6-phosphate decarboxylase
MTGVKDPVARAEEIKKVGVNYVLYHRSIDEETTIGASWNDETVQTVRELCNLNMDIAIAGGVNADILPMLKDIPLYGIVVGRGITAQQNPEEAARALSQCIREIWPG